MVCFASMAPVLAISSADPAVDAALDDPLGDSFLERIREALGPAVEDTGVAYAWAKRGVRRFVQTEAVRLGPSGARINSISPGIIDTPQGRQEAETHAVMAELVKMTPAGREGRAEEVAAVAAFLLSDEASFVNGTDVLADGGVCAALIGPAAGGGVPLG
jgi:NAD(P)-dependent dehydrogenase (short-subunit alcohol dehydrogenase family)